MLALVECALGVATVDLDEEELVELGEGGLPAGALELSLPLVVAADRVGARIVAVVDRRPPLVVSDDAGATWHETGGGLPPGRDVAISPDHPDTVLYASAGRLYLSRDGGRFWEALAVELPEISRVSWPDPPDEGSGT
ncbi:MAG TPA: hypothetical protein VFR43_07995 [Gaiellaceae bacterium]|nr:hypothetical protein [Gaiellaceae bacterium]